MNRKSLIILLLTGIATTLLVGCETGPAPGGPEQTAITTQLSENGGFSPWPQANVVGNIVGPLPCDPSSTDEYCALDFSGVTDTLGNYTLVTDALPADWSIAATEEEGQTNCVTGATWYGNLTTLQGAILVCGQVSSGVVEVTPSSCIYELNNSTGQVIENTCTSTITLSTSPATMSTAHAMTVGTYDEAGDLVVSSSITASSSTSITVPTPDVAGYSVILVVDPTTNQVIGAGLFTRNQVILNPCGTKKNC